MSQVDGILGGNNEVHLTNGADPGVLTKLLGVVSVNLPNPTVGDRDTTDQDSGAVMHSAPGIIEPGTFSFVIKYVPGSAEDLLITEHLTSRAKRPFKIVKKNVTPNREETGTIHLNSFTKDTAGPTDTWTATVTAKISGLPTEANAA